MTQGIAIAAGKQHAFDWSKVAIGTAGGVLDGIPFSDVIQESKLKAVFKVPLGFLGGAGVEAAKNSITQGLNMAYKKGKGEDLSFNWSQFLGAVSSGAINGGAKQWLKLDSVKKNLLANVAIGAVSGVASDSVAQGWRIGLTDSKTYDWRSNIVGLVGGGLKGASKVIEKRAEDNWKNKPVMVVLRMGSFTGGAIADILGDYQKMLAKGDGQPTADQYAAGLQKTVRSLSKKAAEEVGGTFGMIGENRLKEAEKQKIEEQSKAMRTELKATVGTGRDIAQRTERMIALRRLDASLQQTRNAMIREIRDGENAERRMEAIRHMEAQRHLHMQELRQVNVPRGDVLTDFMRHVPLA